MSSKSFLLTNRSGGYLMLSPTPNSIYEGSFFWREGRMYKFLEDLKNPEPVKEIIHHLWAVKRERETFTEEFFVPPGIDALSWKSTKEIDMDLVLDAKESYDDSEWDRNYKLEKENDLVKIIFNKKGKKNYTLYLLIDIKNISWEKKAIWEERNYSYDKERGQKSTRYVYIPLKIHGKKLLIAFGDNLKKVRQDLLHLKTNEHSLRKNLKNYTATVIRKYQHPKEKVNLAYMCSVNTLDQLLVDGKNIGLFAGLPWFFQYWSRDELISLKALMLTGYMKESKKILLKYLALITKNGRIPNRYPHSDLESADSIGWLFKRVEDYIILSQGNDDSNMISLLEESLARLEENTFKDGYFIAGSLETWMDTGWGEDKREGALIEIQALMLNAYKFLYLMTKNTSYQKKELELKKRVRNNFWDGKRLKDGLNNSLIRPNIFIAAYVYPDLLSSEEWKTCFENIIPKLWLPWGGLSTIDKENHLYTPHYTGLNNKSYHRGDSWYFINNMAAIVLDKFGFEFYSHAILSASTKEILEQGVIGAHAELSSADNCSTKGCLAQLWSTALYIELVHSKK